MGNSGYVLYVLINSFERNLKQKSYDYRAFHNLIWTNMQQLVNLNVEFEFDKLVFYAIHSFVFNVISILTQNENIKACCLNSYTMNSILDKFSLSTTIKLYQRRFINKFSSRAFIKTGSKLSHILISIFWHQSF